MGKAYSADLRERIEAHISAGHSRRDASRRFGVSPSFAVKQAQRVAVTGSVAPAQQGRPPGGGKLAAHMAKLIEWVEETPDITMPELAAKLKADRGVTVHPASLSRALLVAGFSRQAQGSSQANRGQDNRRTPSSGRKHMRPLRSAGMLELSQGRWICVRLKAQCSSCRSAAPPRCGWRRQVS